MRNVAILLALALAGCAGLYGGGVEPAPPVTQTIFKQSEVEGSGVEHPFMVHGFQITAGYTWSGRGKVTFQYPAQPHVIVEGSINVAPIPITAAQLHADVAAGRFLLLRDGKPAALSASTTPTEE